MSRIYGHHGLPQRTCGGGRIASAVSYQRTSVGGLFRLTLCDSITGFFAGIEKPAPSIFTIPALDRVTVRHEAEGLLSQQLLRRHG
ncbi:MAG: hypothetical protein ABIG68_02500, partial [Acidobacteriota bacterium]